MAAPVGNAEVTERYALVLCDLQQDFLTGIPEPRRSTLLEQVKELLAAARNARWHIVYTGVRFPPGYAGVPPRHRIFGGLQRRNAQDGDEKVHWFMEGYEGSEIVPDLAPVEGEPVVWRSRLRPSEGTGEALRSKGITKVVVAGLKTGQSVLQTVESLADEGLLIYVVRDCVADSSEERHSAVLDHVINQYADVLASEAFREQIGAEIMLDMHIAFKTAQRAG
mmetsp:Transcript_38691/g.58370  ORF Transcript_38691/g.58370 Transcript_38691/m.58370 type:complete len:223 (+) Transcript_38691:98-766(+)|eukprot:CAMPEP_0195034212 /NCGR_PEP_ID=MMETSP0326_2-20130528/67393_1 /TAXON_ID=2866 ORGANISM="Crypthecodinium cohnii, Strain Seligo" /NCGR_SAMPLE_ID=MMETSP0326_2 /ASSEMBLY_ACC=CAM_ASM_000348 /LENGTH=222 /DNA_ID=CAMNT_0040058971 /DNA_START=76 /DNA_END=744 /DNA_ORIENTATION=-